MIYFLLHIGVVFDVLGKVEGLGSRLWDCANQRRSEHSLSGYQRDDQVGLISFRRSLRFHLEKGMYTPESILWHLGVGLVRSICSWQRLSSCLVGKSSPLFCWYYRRVGIVLQRAAFQPASLLQHCGKIIHSLSSDYWPLSYYLGTGFLVVEVSFPVIILCYPRDRP